jgi:transposase
MTQIETLELLVKTLQEQNLHYQQTTALQAEANKQLTEKIDQLLSQIAWLNRQLFGRKSEKLASLDPNQLSLFDQASQQSTEVQLEEANHQAIEHIKEDKAVGKSQRHNRKLLKNLPVIEVVIEPEGINPEQYKRIGEERTRTLEFEPGRLYVKEIVRPKYGLKDNTKPAEEGQSSVMIAPLPLLPIYKGLPGASMLAEILLQKYEYHMPFYRQVQSFRHLGIRISESTLNGWFKPAAELLRPLYEVLKNSILQSDYIQVDETTLPVINKESHTAQKEYLWMVRSVGDHQVFFHYDNGSRSGETADKLLKPFKGYLQSDGYAG